MKKRFLLVVTVLAVILTTSAYALQGRSADVLPSISFSGTKATCSVSVMGDYATDKIEVDVELWQGSTLVQSWSDQGTEYVDSVRTVSVTKGKVYTLKAYAAINGTDLPMAYITKTCK